jgi:hypothetical protein
VPPGKNIVPMAGELKLITAAEIAAFGAEMAQRGITDLHFYTDEPGVPPANFAAIAAL